MRREPEFFETDELPLVYMARTLRAALKVEELFTAANIDYLVETGEYQSGWLIRRNLTGAFFYVAEADESHARERLLANRYKPYDVKAEK